MKYLFFFFLLIIPSLSGFGDPLAGKAYTVESVPNPVKFNSFVTNPDGILTKQEEEELNLLLLMLEDSSTCQAAVVVLNSIGDEVPKDFATRLFNHWGIGQKNNNGFLLLLVMDQRRVEMETGYGIEGILTDGICKNIQINHMVPYFKEGLYAEGVLEGMKLVTEVLLHGEDASNLIYSDDKSLSGVSLATTIFGVTYFTIIFFVLFYRWKNNKFYHLYIKAGRRPKQKYPPVTFIYWVSFYILLPLVILAAIEFSGSILFFTLAIYGFSGLALLEYRIRQNVHITSVKTDSHKIYQRLTASNNFWWILAIIFPFPFTLYSLVYYSFYKNKFRNMQRFCRQCKSGMHKLNDIEEDNYLNDGQLKEEQIKSVDYDVWKCSHCDNLEVLNYDSLNTSYKECPKCKFKTLRYKTSQVLTSATYTSPGNGIRLYDCKNCQHQMKEYYTIPKKQRSSSSSGSGSRSYSSSSSSRSFGGGRSGGGGAGSSW